LVPVAVATAYPNRSEKAATPNPEADSPLNKAEYRLTAKAQFTTFGQGFAQMEQLFAIRLFSKREKLGCENDTGSKRRGPIAGY